MKAIQQKLFTPNKLTWNISGCRRKKRLENTYATPKQHDIIERIHAGIDAGFTDQSNTTLYIIFF